MFATCCMVGLLSGYLCRLINSPRRKWDESRVLLIVVFSIFVAFDDSDVLVEAEDAASEQERLRHIVEQTGSDIVDFDHLISYERDAAHDEQHRTGILGDFEAFVDFHGLHCSASCSAEDKGDDVTDCL